MNQKKDEEKTIVSVFVPLKLHKLLVEASDIDQRSLSSFLCYAGKRYADLVLKEKR